MKESVLQEIGFTEREERVYEALVELGPSLVGAIARKAGLPRTKVYDTLTRLIERGVVSFVMIHRRRQFRALPPRELLVMLDERRRRLSGFVKELEHRRKTAESQTATVYEGHKAIRAMYEILLDELTRRDFYWVFAFRQEYMWSQEAKDLLRYVHSMMAEKKIDDRLLAHTSVRNFVLETYRGIWRMKIRFTSHDFPQGLFISKGRVVNIMWSPKPVAFEIKSAQLFAQYKKFFEDVWRSAR